MLKAAYAEIFKFIGFRELQKFWFDLLSMNQMIAFSVIFLVKSNETWLLIQWHFKWWDDKSGPPDILLSENKFS